MIWWSYPKDKSFKKLFMWPFSDPTHLWLRFGEIYLFVAYRKIVGHGLKTPTLRCSGSSPGTACAPCRKAQSLPTCGHLLHVIPSLFLLPFLIWETTASRPVHPPTLLHWPNIHWCPNTHVTTRQAEKKQVVKVSRVLYCTDQKHLNT